MMGNKFGFGVLHPRSLTLNFPLPALYQHIVREEPSIRGCIHCGMCSSVCTANRFEETHFYKMLHLLRYGMTQEAITYAKRCLLCGNCVLACPRNVNIRHVMFLLKQHVYERSF